MIHPLPFCFRRRQSCPMLLASVPAGFPSPAEDYVDKGLDLNEFLIKHPAATFFVRAEGESMIGAGIHSGDVLVVDRSLEASHGRIVIAVLNGEFMVKRISRLGGKVRLLSENPAFPPVAVNAESEAIVWGVVTCAIHPVLTP